MVRLRSIAALVASITIASAHTVISYPGWRGNNLHANGSYGDDDYTTGLFPYGMQWSYPCGGLKTSNNRTYWPLDGGALGFQPGWFQGHLTALVYVNIGLPDVHSNDLGYMIPQNYTHNVVKPFQITGPTNENYPGFSVCLPRLDIRAAVPGYNFTEGMNITIQLVEAAQHGAALYSCSDVTLTSNMSLVPTVAPDNCTNSPQISEQYQVFTASMTGAASSIRAAGALGALTLGAAFWSLL